MTSPLELLRPVAALAARDAAIFRSYRLALVLDFVFGVVDLLVYFFVSKTFGNHAVANLGTAPSYFAFAAVGIVMTLVVTAASTEVAYRLRDEQMTGTIELLCAEPLATFQIALGFAAFPFLLAIARGILYLCVAAALPGVSFPHADFLGCGLIVLSSGAALAGIGIALAGFVVVVKRSIGVVALVGLALGLAGGAFFPVSVLPGWLHWLAAAVPTRYAFDGMRAALFGGGDWPRDLGILALTAVISLPLGVAAFALGLHHARRRGSLGEF